MKSKQNPLPKVTNYNKYKSQYSRLYWHTWKRFAKDTATWAETVMQNHPRTAWLMINARWERIMKWNVIRRKLLEKRQIEFIKCNISRKKWEVLLSFEKWNGPNHKRWQLIGKRPNRKTLYMVKLCTNFTFTFLWYH